MKQIRQLSFLIINGLLAFSVLTACSDDNTNTTANKLGELTEGDEVFGKAIGNFSAEEWYPDKFIFPIKVENINIDSAVFKDFKDMHIISFDPTDPTKSTDEICSEIDNRILKK